MNQNQNQNNGGQQNQGYIPQGQQQQQYTPNQNGGQQQNKVVAIKNICFAENYKSNNEDRTKWHTVGTLFVKEDGKMSIKLDTVPVNFDGNFQVFDREQNQNNGGQQNQGYIPQGQQQQQYTPNQNGGQYQNN